MLYRFRLISNEEEDFLRDFEVSGTHTFYDFHMAIQNEMKYDKSQISSFFLCNEDWEKEREITLFGLSDEEIPELLIMDKEKIGDHIHEKKQKLLYVFDVFNERSFYIEVLDILKEPALPSPPRCCKSRGHAPQQILLDQMFNDRSSFLDMDTADLSSDSDFPETDSMDDYNLDTGDPDDSSFDEE